MLVKRVVRLTITAPRFSNISLFDSSTGIKLVPLRIKILGKEQILVFPNLWRGDYVIKTQDKAYPLTVKKSGYDKDDDIILTYRVRIGLRASIRKPGKFKVKYIKTLNHLGWQKTIKGSDKLTAVCDYLSNTSGKEIGRDALVIPTPVQRPVSTFNDLKLEHPSVCIIQNHQIKQKSQTLLKFIKVMEKTPNITYYVSRGLPENQNNKNYNKVIQALKSINNVIIVDINHANKFDYLNSVDLYILASGLDCTPATIIEAYLSEKPVLASRVGGVPEMIIDGKTGWSIENDNTEEWISKINTIISDKKQLNKMGQFAKQFALEKYSFENISKQIYKEVTK